MLKGLKKVERNGPKQYEKPAILNEIEHGVRLRSSSIPKIPSHGNNVEEITKMEERESIVGPGADQLDFGKSTSRKSIGKDTLKTLKKIKNMEPEEEDRFEDARDSFFGKSTARKAFKKSKLKTLKKDLTLLLRLKLN